MELSAGVWRLHRCTYVIVIERARTHVHCIAVLLIFKVTFCLWPILRALSTCLLSTCWNVNVAQCV